MLEEMLKYKMFLSHITLWKDMPADADVIRAIWSYREKMFTNRKKARLCGNGKPLKPKKKMYHETYTACTSMFGVRLNIAIAAYKGRKPYCTDAINAYAQSGPFSKRTYLVIDKQIKEWWDSKQTSLSALCWRFYLHYKDTTSQVRIGNENAIRH